MTETFNCQKCGRVLAYKEGNEVIFEDKRIVAPLVKWVKCIGDPRSHCGHINYIEPGALEMRKF